MFTFSKKIDFFDCDPAGIMFYGRIFELCHSAYEAMIESFNLSEDYWTNDKFVVPIIHSEASYHKPLSYRDTAEIKIMVTQLKSSSFELSYTVFNSKKEKTHVVKTVHVFVDKLNWKKCAMPEEINKCFEKHFNT